MLVMFENFTEKARRVVFFARYEASLSGGQTIDPEHILLGLLREDPELFRRIAPDREISHNAISNEIKALYSGAPARGASVDMPLAPASKQVFAAAVVERARVNAL